ncbi:MAG: ATP synthase subunit I [Acidobacteriota bacterium]
MNEILSYALSLAAGFVLGYIFFGGLWWTVSRLPKMKHPMLWTFLSLFLRLGISLIGFYLIARKGSWIHILICLVGFMTIRFILTTPKQKKMGKSKKGDAG